MLQPARSTLSAKKPVDGTAMPGRLPSGWVGLGLALISVAFLTVLALWYGSAGHFPAFPNIQNDYVDLGTAFLHGQISLLQQPDPRLADLGDPYEFTQRKGIPYRWDASYYGGKYYLYWGPAPALVSAALEALTGTPPAASVLVLLPFFGLIAIVSRLLWLLAGSWGRGYRLSVWLFILAGFCNLPMLVTLGQPRHYQASILYGQFFLLLGVAAVLEQIRGRSLWWMALAGLAWGLAIASRYNLAISVFAFVLALGIWRPRTSPAALWRPLGVLLVPVLLCLLGLGAYNVARFGDPLETGLTYQLTIPELRQASYSRSYIRSGLYIYLLYPLTPDSAFPFMHNPHFRPSLLPPWIQIPVGRQFDQICLGLLTTVPLFWSLAIAVPLAIVGHREPGIVAAHTQAPWPPLILKMLAAGAAGQFLFLLLFFYVAERYLVDLYVPSMIVVAGLLWQASSVLNPRPLLRAAFWVPAGFLGLCTAAIGYFGCFGVPVLVSNYYDPRAVGALAHFWNTFAAALRF